MVMDNKLSLIQMMWEIPLMRRFQQTICEIQNLSLNFIKPNTSLHIFTLKKKDYLNKLGGQIRNNNENTIIDLVGDRISTSHKNMRLTQLFLENRNSSLSKPQ
jgi:hypothetical protein